MKKLIPILLVVLLMVGLMPIGAYADSEENSDVFEFNDSTTATSNNGLFALVSTGTALRGWLCGADKSLTISAVDSRLKITHIDFTSAYTPTDWSQINVSGNAQKGSFLNGKGSVTNINAQSITFSGGQHHFNFRTITVYYTGSHVHQFRNYTVTKPATCSAPGIKAAKCEYCEFVDEQVIDIDPNAHSFGEYTVVTPATCIATGLKTAKCEYCEAVDEQVIDIDPNVHSFGEYTVLAPATCSSVGAKTAKCAYCTTFDIQSIDIDPNAHRYSDTWSYNSTYHWREVMCGCEVEPVYAEHSWQLSGLKLKCSCGAETSWWGGSTLSEGNGVIVIVIAAAAVIALGAIVIVKKKKKA